MSASRSEVLVGRRYLERGFLDAAMKLFLRNPDEVEPADWTRLAERLLERNRMPDVVRVCEEGHVPLPRERMLAVGDHYLERKNLDEAIRYFEMAGADRERWARVVDVLASLPDREHQAISVAERHLSDEPVAG